MYLFPPTSVLTVRVLTQIYPISDIQLTDFMCDLTYYHTADRYLRTHIRSNILGVALQGTEWNQSQALLIPRQYYRRYLFFRHRVELFY